MQFNNYATGGDGGRAGSGSFAQQRRSEADSGRKFGFGFSVSFMAVW